MTIDEAIEILKSDRFGTVWPTPSKEIDAVKLGIEALKRLEQLRGYSMTQVDTRLPGETEG